MIIKNNKTALILIFLITVALLLKNDDIYSQNSILVHKKKSKGHYFIHANEKVKVITINEDTIKGRILLIKDSTFIINSTHGSFEVPISKIKFLYSNKSRLLKVLVGVPLIIASGVTTFVLILYIPFFGSSILSDPVYIKILLIDMAAIGLSSYLLFHKDRDNIPRDYDIYIIK